MRNSKIFVVLFVIAIVTMFSGTAAAGTITSVPRPELRKTAAAKPRLSSVSIPTALSFTGRSSSRRPRTSPPSRVANTYMPTVPN